MATVKVILRGGLGNQMFQYAAGLNLALKYNARLVLDTTYLNDRFPRREFTYHEFDLDIFKLASEPKFAALSKISSSLPIPGLWLGMDLVWAAVKKIFGGKDSVVWGFYQNEKYFIEYEDAVRAAFCFKYPLEGEVVALAKEARVENSVSIHVRRGDYVKYKSVQTMMGDTNIGYYEAAIAYISAHVENPKFFIFSDDIEWCKKNIKAPAGSIYLDRASAGPKDCFHFELMSLCKHNIIANSTFSWWGAWLNANPDKIVVAPEQWRVDGKNEDIIPEGWIKI